MEIKINNETCIRCSKCVKVCPSVLFTKGDDVKIESAVGCIVCGHCVAACPSDSVIHSEFPADKVHRIDYSQMPTPDQVMLLCKVRRSNRAFSATTINKETLEHIVEAAHRAPTASNLQQVEFTMITDPEKLRAVSEFTIGVFDAMLKKLKNPILKPILKIAMPDVFRYVPVFERVRKEFAAGNDLILRKATALMFVHTPSGSRFGTIDANLAYQNGSLMAEAMGISQFYTGFVLNAIKQNKGKLEKALGIEGTIQAGMALGIPQFRYEKYIDKKPFRR